MGPPSWEREEGTPWGPSCGFGVGQGWLSGTGENLPRCPLNAVQGAVLPHGGVFWITNIPLTPANRQERADVSTAEWGTLLERELTLGTWGLILLGKSG